MRAAAWIGLILLAFLPVQIAALFAADRLTAAIGVGFPERELVISLAVTLGGVLMLTVVGLTGRLVGSVNRLSAGWRIAGPILLAALTAYVIVLDVRSGAMFESDQALPEIFLPYCVVLLASGALGHRLARERPARRGWTWVIRTAAVLVVVLIAVTVAKMAADGGDYALDSPVTLATMAVSGAYAVVTVLRAH